MIGITSYGAYIPKLRLNRMAIVDAMGWFNPAIISIAKGERSICNWDEDTITMAVAAARNAIIGINKSEMEAVYLASTTMPYADRQNAGIVSAALNLKKELDTSDITGSQRAGVTALISALISVKSGDKKKRLVVASDKRETKAGYFYEMWFGDGAGALTVGSENVVAEYKGSYTVTYDFVDHFRAADKKFDYTWEERWARDEGYAKIIPEAINGLFKKLNITIEDVDKLIYPCFFKADHKKIAIELKATPEKLIDNLHEITGETGCAHPFIMLCSALEKAQPGDNILVAGYGQGCSALYFTVTKHIKKFADQKSFSNSIANRKATDNYLKWLQFRDLIKTEMGIRAEAPTQTAMTTLYRKNKMILGLLGGICSKCGTRQFPKMDICVNPKCGAVKTQNDFEFANEPAKIKTFTADMLSVSVDPPALYGLIQFDKGGRILADFTDCTKEELKVGLPVTMEFKRRNVDKQRGMTNYFWKAVPVFNKENIRIEDNISPNIKKKSDKIDFSGKVAVVTGAGAGLGKVYAIELAKRGCKVVVNDFGGSKNGIGDGSTTPAQQTVNEIKALGQEAVANFDNVALCQGGENIIKTALNSFGKVDILINNAGILRDKTLINMDNADWKAVLDVHLNGAYNLTKPAFTMMKENKYGRIIMTTSAAGLYGNFGQTNYSAAKLALVGFMNSLKLEGQKYNINVNTIAPAALSRLTQGLLPDNILQRMKPEFIAALVLYLASDKCLQTGGIYNACMEYYNKVSIITGKGKKIGTKEKPPTPEMIAENIEAIDSMQETSEYMNMNSAIASFIQNN